MIIGSLSLEEYFSIGLKPSNVFGSEAFVRLNAKKAEKLICVVDNDNRIGIIFGLKGGQLYAPWSAPYLSVDTVPGVTLAEAHDFGIRLRQQFSGIKVKVCAPPLCYESLEIAFIKGFQKNDDTLILDTSFHIPLSDASEKTGWNRNARRNLRLALAASLTFERCANPEDCYNLIASHHGTHGYTMAMTLSQVSDTAKIIPVDFWVVRHNDKIVAAAYCYRVRHDIVQVINSGDNDYGRQLGAMTFLARNLIDHYREQLTFNEGVTNALLDYGPTSVNGVQNEGLVRFKTSIGCLCTTKTTLLT